MREKGGRTGQRTAPTTMRRKDSKPEGQEMVVVVEWRCLSRREERVSKVLSEALTKSENRFQACWRCVASGGLRGVVKGQKRSSSSRGSRLSLDKDAAEVGSPAA